MAKYLGETGLVYLWSQIKTWVGNYVKITSSTGKDTITSGNNSIDVYDWAQASSKPSYTADEITDGTTYKRYSSTEQTKLNGIATGAEVNQNAFGKVKVGSTNVEADAKIDTLELAVASNSVVSITPDATNDKVTFDVDKDLSKYNNSTSGFITASDIPAGVSPYTSTPEMDGTGSAGTSSLYAKGDHVHPTDTSRVATALIGAANGICPLDANTKIDSQYLPSYVDDVIEAYARTGQTALTSTWLATGSASGTAITPETGKIYVLMAATTDYSANTEFRWGGSAYVKINDGGISEMTTSEMDTATSNWA